MFNVFALPSCLLFTYLLANRFVCRNVCRSSKILSENEKYLWKADFVFIRNLAVRNILSILGDEV